MKQDNDNSFTGLPDELIVEIGTYLDIKDQISLSKTCLLLNSIFQPSINFVAFKKLAQAVIDDDRKTVKHLLNHNPSFILYTPTKTFTLQSQLTWQKFHIEEDVLTIAAKRKQIEMLKLLLGYLDQFEQTKLIFEFREKALSTWSLYKKPIIIPQQYLDIALKLIDTFKNETFPNKSFSDHTQSVIILFYDFLLPKNAIKLNDYFDPELFILSIFQVFTLHATSFLNNDVASFLRNLHDFCVKGIGLTQGILTPETAKKICHEFQELPMNDDVINPTLKDGSAYYRPSPNSKDGIGLSFHVTYHGEKNSLADADIWKSLWEKFILDKQEAFERLRDKYQQANQLRHVF